MTTRRSLAPRSNRCGSTSGSRSQIHVAPVKHRVKPWASQTSGYHAGFHGESTKPRSPQPEVMTPPVWLGSRLTGPSSCRAPRSRAVASACSASAAKAAGLAISVAPSSSVGPPRRCDIRSSACRVLRPTTPPEASRTTQSSTSGRPCQRRIALSHKGTDIPFGCSSSGSSTNSRSSRLVRTGASRRPASLTAPPGRGSPYPHAAGVAPSAPASPCSTA